MSTVRLTIELNGGDPVTGWVEPADGPREAFEGLLEMLATFDRLRSGESAGLGEGPAEPRRKKTG
jgi:hypothetical protein